jgi:hypothetical protein
MVRVDETIIDTTGSKAGMATGRVREGSVRGKGNRSRTKTAQAAVSLQPVQYELLLMILT